MLGTPIQEQFGSDSGSLGLSHGSSEPVVNDAEMVMRPMEIAMPINDQNVDMIELRAWRTMMATRKLVMRGKAEFPGKQPTHLPEHVGR